MKDLEPDLPVAASRPEDPAGTRPRHDPRDLLPAHRAAIPEHAVDADATAEEILDEPAAGAPDGDLLPERIPDAAAPALASTAPSTPHAPRFQFLAGALVAVGAATLTLLVAFVVNGTGESGKDSGPGWSAWRPSGSGSATDQIASHVGRRYHHGDGRQLVLVQGGGMEIAGLPLTVALRQTPAEGGDIKLYDDKGVLFRLCGLGKDCAIASGKPSPQRHLLLRREALELALYSFRYVDGVKQVAVFMPPPPGEQPSQALFFRKGELGEELQKPLDTTLSGTVPTVRTVTRSPDALLVDQLTLPTIFRFSLTQANQDDRAFLVLDPFTPGDDRSRKGQGRTDQGQATDQSQGGRLAGGSGSSSG